MQSNSIFGSPLWSDLLFLCRSVGVVHCDLKPENVLVLCDGSGNIQTVKIVDFGISVPPTCDALGTPHYTAPEVFLKGVVSFKWDVWSLGILAVVLLTGQLPTPYQGITAMALSSRVPEVSTGELLSSTADCSSGPMRDFLEWCLTPDPENRPETKDLLGHEVFAQGVQRVLPPAHTKNSVTLYCLPPSLPPPPQ